MSKNQGFITVQFEQFFQAQGLPDDLIKIKRRELKKAGVLSKVENQETLNITKYSKHALAELNSSKIKARNAHLLIDISTYYSLARDYLDEWISILAVDFELDSDDIGRSRMKEIEDEFKNVLADSKIIYEHFHNAFEMSLELVFSKKHNGNSNH